MTLTAALKITLIQLPVFSLKPLVRVEEVYDKVLLREVFYLACSELKLRCLYFLYLASKAIKIQTEVKTTP